MAHILGGPFLLEGASRWSPRGNTKSGPLSLSGNDSISRSDGGGFWAGMISSIPIRTAADIRYWRAIEAIAEGGVNEFVLPSCETRTAPASIIDGVRHINSGTVPHSDDTPFDDDTEYQQTPIEAYAVAAAVYRATTITLLFVEGLGGQCVGGETFSIDHPAKDSRRYVIKEVTSDNEGGSQTVKIWPPLREAIEADVYLEFIQPKCLVRIDVPSALDLELSMRKHASPSMSFREAMF